MGPFPQEPGAIRPLPKRRAKTAANTRNGYASAARNWASAPIAGTKPGLGAFIAQTAPRNAGK